MINEKSYLMVIMTTSDQEKITIQDQIFDPALISITIVVFRTEYRSESEMYLRRKIGLEFEPEIESARGRKVKMMTLCLFQI